VSPKNLTFDSLTSENRSKRQISHDLCRQFNRAPSKGNLKKLKQLFLSHGSDLKIEQGFHCDYGDKISFGDRVYININCTLLDGGNINFGDDVLVGPNVQILTVNHPTTAGERLKKTSLISDVMIGNNVWIGAGAIVLPGIRVGNNSVIAAGAIVTKDVEESALVGGNPARVIKLLP